LDALNGSLKPTLVRASLPKFFIREESLPVPRALRELGMTSAFDAKVADFTRMAHPTSPDDEVYLTEIFQSVVLHVDEAGTEAAAATANVVAVKPVVRAEFKADHPFLFFLRDRGSGLILFMGRVSSP